MLNQQIGPYKIISKLGEGGMANVYLAEKGALGKQVALKVLKKEFIYNQHIRGRFLSEAKKMINLNHPNIVGVQDLIDENDFVAIELEYVDGKTLKEHLNDHGALPDDEIERLFKQMLDAVGYIHAKGYIHRDIKPSNFMLTQSGIIKLTDFGIAKNADDANIDYTGTGTGMQMGTPKYMSPEQVRSTKDVDHRSDIYSLGVVLWEMVTGKVPYDIETESTFDVFRKIVDEPLEPTNSRWDKVIEKCTNKKIENRYQKVGEIKIEETISEYPNDKTDQIVTSANGGIDSTDKKKSYSFKAPIVILFIIVGFVMLKFLIDSYENNMNSEDSKKVTVQEQNLPQWKIDFEERWEDAVSTEEYNSDQMNYNNFNDLLTTLPSDANDEKNKVNKKLNELKQKLQVNKFVVFEFTVQVAEIFHTDAVTEYDYQYNYSKEISPALTMIAHEKKKQVSEIIEIRDLTEDKLYYQKDLLKNKIEENLSTNDHMVKFNLTGGYYQLSKYKIMELKDDVNSQIIDETIHKFDSYKEASLWKSNNKTNSSD